MWYDNPTIRDLVVSWSCILAPYYDAHTANSLNVCIWRNNMCLANFDSTNTDGAQRRSSQM